MSEPNNTDKTDSEPTVSRRDALAAVAGVAVGGAGAAAIAQSGAADAEGQLGTSTNPVGAAYVQEIRGPIVDQGDTITELTDIRVAEDGASISPDPDTLIVRYDPNGTV